jgi:GWxTD domain-containing protein
LKLRITTAISILLWATAVSAQTSGYLDAKDPTEPRVEWDYNVFGPSPEGPFRLEVYYKAYNDGLSYRKDNGSYVAEYELEAIVYEDGEQVAGTSFKEKYTVESFPRTLSLTDFLVNQLNIGLEGPGKYELVLRLRDLRSGHTTEKLHKFEISRNYRDWTMSRIEFARIIQRAVDTSQFNKQGWVIVPSVSRTYGDESQLQCPVYMEIYGPAESAGTPLKVLLYGRDPLDNRLLDTVLEVQSQGRVTPVIASLSVADLSPGRYTVHVQLSSERGKPPLWEDEDWFDITWSLSTLLRTDFQTAVEQLRFIAKDKERDSLLESPDSLRAISWRAFWDRRDPTPGTPGNEFRDEYYRRIRYANTTFSVGKRPGWRTDRGMIYIQYGEPDEVDRHPFDMDGFPYNAPWQVWRYYSTNREFVFVDRRGSSDFELQYPYDGEYWRRN